MNFYFLQLCSFLNPPRNNIGLVSLPFDCLDNVTSYLNPVDQLNLMFCSTHFRQNVERIYDFRFHEERLKLGYSSPDAELEIECKKLFRAYIFMKSIEINNFKKGRFADAAGFLAYIHSRFPNQMFFPRFTLKLAQDKQISSSALNNFIVKAVNHPKHYKNFFKYLGKEHFKVDRRKLISRLKSHVGEPVSLEALKNYEDNELIGALIIAAIKTVPYIFIIALGCWYLANPDLRHLIPHFVILAFIGLHVHFYRTWNLMFEDYL